MQRPAAFLLERWGLSLPPLLLLPKVNVPGQKQLLCSRKSADTSSRNQPQSMSAASLMLKVYGLYDANMLDASRRIFAQAVCRNRIWQCLCRGSILDLAFHCEVRGPCWLHGRCQERKGIVHESQKVAATLQESPMNRKRLLHSPRRICIIHQSAKTHMFAESIDACCVVKRCRKCTVGLCNFD